MSDLTHKQRTERLAEYVKTIAAERNVESVYSTFSQKTMGLESTSSSRLHRAQETIQLAIQGKEVSPKRLFRAEAIIHQTGRPSRLIENDWFQPFPNEFRHLTENSEIKKRLQKAIPSVGRIDLPNRPSTYGGTGFIVGDGIVMTNRHVAEIFTNGVGKEKVVIKPWEPGEINFKREWSDDDTPGFQLTKCIMIHPYWDMALFEADIPSNVEPLTLSVEPAGDLRRRDVCVIGYPAFDPERNSVDLQMEIFNGKFNVKRIAPGRIVRRKEDIGSSWLDYAPVDALAHDSSTLGGNSGSAVVEMLNGSIAALHFAGRFMVENYAIPCHELARDRRVADAGVNFESPLPPASNALDRYWRDADRTSFGFDDNFVSRKESSSSVTNNSVTFEVPLKVTVSLGDTGDNTITLTNGGGDSGGSGNNDGPGIPDDPGTDSDSPLDPSERIGGGYDLNFLSKKVPTPKLTSAIQDDAFLFQGSSLIPYTHFSVCQSKSRTLPRFVAWNIDGANMKSLSRQGIRFVRDRRVPDQFQAGNELYHSNPYDRGHVARRVDLNWGSMEEAQKANRESFFFTNMTPQHQSFNQSSRRGLWGELENAIMEDIDVEDLRVSVMAGPIFKDDDTVHRNVKIPADFWKLIAFRDQADNQFKVAAYILSQRQLIPSESLELDAFHLYQTSLTNLATETNLNFDAIRGFDSFTSDQESVFGSGVREIKGRGDVVQFKR